MSATNRGAERRVDDAYMTPSWCVRRLLEVWTPKCSSILVEPAVGDGAIVRTLDNGYTWWTYDVRDVTPVRDQIQWRKQGSFLAHQQGNFLDVDEGSCLPVAVITNPPYSLAEEFVRHSAKLYPNADLVFLLRLGFLASAKRLPLWQDIGVPNIYVLPNRPSFTGGGTDASDYAWFHWPSWYQQAGVLQILIETPASERNS